MEIEISENRILEVEVIHSKDKNSYILFVIPYTIERVGDSVIKSNTPTRDGGFQYKIEHTNRKSKKRIDQLNQIIVENKENILNSFLNQDDQSIINLF